MTGLKMIGLLQLFATVGHPLRGVHIGVTGGGELYFDFPSQPDKGLHKMLLKRGFVQPDPRRADLASWYVYRP